ncbi:MAG: D-isomer specific 2-hydroxyacid dehydrogenase NAD-binding protein [Chloroflexi bacterium]|nr:D-isomer specific 2-hydroxyacid dehydrogenase NAD-binding protein [Chloroflexota bacterium]
MKIGRSEMPHEGTVTVGLSPAFPSEYLHLLHDVSPRLRFMQLKAGTVPAEAGEIEVLATWYISRNELAELAPKLTRLRWVQSPIAGVGDQRLHELFGPHVTITGAAGVYGDMVAEHAMALILALYKRLPELLEQQHEERWDDLEARTLAGQTLGVVGVGGIGRSAARMARAFGMKTVGVRRGAGAVPELDTTLPQEELPSLLAGSDVVLLSVPLTPETQGMVDRKFLQQMKRSALLVNVARGKIVVTDDLVEALRDGWIAGAGLDVTEPEPLPKGHPLWQLPGVIITPHHANPSLQSREHAVRRFAENLARYVRGEPLIAVVDPQRGY